MIKYPALGGRGGGIRDKERTQTSLTSEAAEEELPQRAHVSEEARQGEEPKAGEGCEGLSPLEGRRAGVGGTGQAVVGTEEQRQCWGGSVWRASRVQLPCLLVKDTGAGTGWISPVL